MSDLLARDVLVISQKPKFVEMTNEYEITDETGSPLGVIREEGQSKARKLMVASAAGIDTALKQDDAGGFGFGGLGLDI